MGDKRREYRDKYSDESIPPPVPESRPCGVKQRGHVTAIVVDRQCGFIKVADSADVFFPAHALQGLTFDDSLIGREVEFYCETRPDGKLRGRGVHRAW